LFITTAAVSDRIVLAGGTQFGSCKLGQGRLKERLVMSSLMLVCAVMASLAFGVLVAYGICQVMFHLFRVHSVSAAKERMGTRNIQVVAEG
jgi:hypothetical protein